jgi:para-nitrobenzyl esterase
VVDGVELPRVPLDALSLGDFARVPLIIGWNRDEGTLHTLSMDRVESTEVEGFVRDVFGERAALAVRARYVRATPRDSLTDIVTDGIYACEARRVARAVSRRGVPAYLYQWTRALDHPDAHPLGATHSVELFFLWGNPGRGVTLSEAELPLSRTLMETWGRFARAGNPNGSAVRWPRYSTDTDEHLVLDLVPRSSRQLKTDVCDFWDEVREAGR